MSIHIFVSYKLYNMHLIRVLTGIILITVALNHNLVAQKKNMNRGSAKVEQLLAKMSLEEKIGQMTQLNITTIMTDSVMKHYDSVMSFKLDTAKLIQYITKYHIGSFLNGRGISKNSWFPFMDQLHRLNLKYSRSKIPLLYGVDHVHGSSYLKEGTIFPHNINIAATFDTSHAGQMARVTVYETAALGHNWIFSPVMDLGKNKYWGRYYETFGEDPVLASRMGVAVINGIQKSTEVGPYKIAACAKHFYGYSDPRSGWDRSPAEIPEQHLREFFLPSFKAAIDAGVKTIMINSGEVNGIPVHSSYEILTKLLREELGFKGIAITDWMDIIALEKMHFVAENEKEATYKAIMAGVDMSMVAVTTNFCTYVKELVLEGRIPQARIDESVRRILTVKEEIGLFDHVYPDAAGLAKIGLEASKEKALQAARASMVLLKNEDKVLPLKNKGKIVVTGATAQSKVALLGGWTYRFAPKSDWWIQVPMQTVYDALRKECNQAEVVFADAANLATVAANADVIVFVAGEKDTYAETDGNIDDLDLSKDQQDWGHLAMSLGKPVVMVLTEGRPRLLGDLYDKSKGVLFAGLPGLEGAQAVAEVLSGKVNPSGKMPFTYPFKAGHMISYNYKRSEYSMLRPVAAPLKRFALAQFGEGLSYTQFAYSDLKLSDTVVGHKQELLAQVKITNTGAYEGKESVLWFVSDEIGSITRPIKELQHFEKINLKLGESKVVYFSIIPLEHLSFPDKNGKVVMEPGYFTLMVGSQQARFKLK